MYRGKNILLEMEHSPDLDEYFCHQTQDENYTNLISDVHYPNYVLSYRWKKPESSVFYNYYYRINRLLYILEVFFFRFSRTLFNIL